MHLVEDDSYALTRFEGEGEPALFDLSGKTDALPLVVLDDDRARASASAGSSSRRARRGRSRRARPTSYITPSLLEPGDGVRVHHARQLRAAPGRLREILRARRDAMLAALASTSRRRRGRVRRAATSSGWSCPSPSTGVPCWREPRASRRLRARRSAPCRARCASRTPRSAPGTSPRASPGLPPQPARSSKRPRTWLPTVPGDRRVKKCTEPVALSSTASTDRPRPALPPSASSP